MNKGLTIVELLVGMAAALIILGETILFVTRGAALSREHTEQERITEDARVQMERLSDAIRDARSLDLSGDGLATLPPEKWLQHGSDYDIQFYTNLDNDPDIERLHYFLENTDLKRGIRDPYDSEEEERVTVVARSLRNLAQGQPLFRFTAAGSAPKVEITLIIDSDPQQDPAAAKLSTIVVPRASDIIVSP